LKTIVLIELNSKGHHPEYLKRFSQVLLAMGHRVVAGCPFPDEISLWINEECGSSSDRFSSFHLAATRPQMFSVLTVMMRWLNVSRSIGGLSLRSGNGIDLVFFDHLEDFILRPPFHRALWLLFQYPWAGLFLQPWRRLRNGKAGRQGNPFKALCLDSCRGVALLDETAYEELAEFISGERLHIIPDFTDASLPAEDPDAVRALKHRAKGRTIIGLFGFLKKYKGLITFIEVARRADPAKFFFVLAGELAVDGFTEREQESLMDFFKSQPENCFFRLERIQDEKEYSAMVQAVDVIFAAFEDFPHSSNTLAKAAAFKKPVVVSEGYCMARRTREFKMGEVVEQGNAEQIVKAIVEMQANYSNTINRANFSGYLQRHSVEKLRRVFEKLLHG
jgi:glycosyltransferase involved in cell wall biosynthesis